MPRSRGGAGGVSRVAAPADVTAAGRIETAAFDNVAAWGREALALARETKGASPRAVQTKADAFDLTTPADTAIERRLRERIAQAFPTHAVMGEEQGTSEGPYEWQWVLDPIDGTFNYFTGLPGAACSIALRRGNEIRVGAIVDFTTGAVVRARGGGGGLVSDDAVTTNAQRRAGARVLRVGLGADERPRGRHAPDARARATDRAATAGRSGVRAAGHCARGWVLRRCGPSSLGRRRRRPARSGSGTPGALVVWSASYRPRACGK